MKIFIYTLINPTSGRKSHHQIIDILRSVFPSSRYQIDIDVTHSKKDGKEKANRAMTRGYDLLLIAGGDGTLNSIGSTLIGSRLPIGVLPTGSGNGFARHFRIPLSLAEAAYTLREGKLAWLDVGFANENPFFITCSCAWEASLSEIYAQTPFRGLAAYLYAGLHQTAFYRAQPLHLQLPNQELYMHKPFICTFANLSQFGNGCMIAPQAMGDDGKLHLVAIEQSDMLSVLKTLSEQRPASHS